MSLYAVIKDRIVKVIAVAEAPLDTGDLWICVDNFNPMPGPQWIYEGGKFSPPKELINFLPNIITKLAMIDRFTQSEYEAILLGAKSDVQVQSWLDRFLVSNSVNLEDPRTVSGINLLVSKNLLTQDRADKILTDPVKEHERP